MASIRDHRQVGNIWCRVHAAQDGYIERVLLKEGPVLLSCS